MSFPAYVPHHAFKAVFGVTTASYSRDKAKQAIVSMGTELIIVDAMCSTQPSAQLRAVTVRGDSLARRVCMAVAIRAMLWVPQLIFRRDQADGADQRI